MPFEKTQENINEGKIDEEYGLDGETDGEEQTMQGVARIGVICDLRKMFVQNVCRVEESWNTLVNGNRIGSD